MKKIIALLAVLMMVFAMVACAAPAPAAEPETAATEAPAAEATEAPAEELAAPAVKIGVILVHDENTGYDAAHIDGIKAGAEAAGIPADSIIWKYNVTEDEKCYDTAIDLIVTPTRTIETRNEFPKPTHGVMWYLLEDDMLGRIPPLQELWAAEFCR